MSRPRFTAIRRYQPAILAHLVVTAALTLGCASEEAGQSAPPTADGPERSRGTYRGTSWEIGQDHVLYWDGAAYAPHALRGPEKWTDDSPSKLDVTDLAAVKTEVDELMAAGMTEFLVLDSIGDWEPDRPGEDQAFFDWLDATTSYISERGGTYVFWYDNLLHRPDVLEFLPDYDYWKDPKILDAQKSRLARFATHVAKPGLRAVLFSLEIDSPAHGFMYVKDDVGMRDTIEDLELFKELMCEYGRAVKASLGDVPVLLRTSGHRVAMPYLYSVCNCESLQGVTAQYSRGTPAAVEAEMSDNPYMSRFNVCPRTKMLWTNHQVYNGGIWPPYEDATVMSDTLKVGISNGSTGNLWDYEDYTWIWYGADGDAHLLSKSRTWFAEMSSEIKTYIKSTVESGKFLPGNTPAPPAFEYVASTATETQIIKAATENAAAASFMARYPCLKPLSGVDGLAEFSRFWGKWEVVFGLTTPEEETIEVYAITYDKDGKEQENQFVIDNEMKGLGYRYVGEDLMVTLIDELGISCD